MEVPVVAPSVAGIPELVEHGVSGLLFAAGDWSALADQLDRMLADSALAKRLAQEGRRRVLDEFAVERAVVPLITQFRERPYSREDAQNSSTRPIRSSKSA